MKKESRRGFHVFVNVIRTITFATLVLGAGVIAFREKLIQIPYVFQIFISIIILAGIIAGIITYLFYSSSSNKPDKKKKTNKNYDKNLNKLSSGEFAEVVPLEKIYETSKSEIQDFLLEKARFFAVLQQNCVKCIMIYQSKNGEIKAAKERRYAPEEFFNYFTFSKKKVPESMNELKVKLQ